MPQTVNINGVAISYPIIGDTEWGVEATKFAELVGVVLQKIGQGNQSTTNNIVIGSISSPGNLTVASGDLSVSGNTALTGNLTTNGTANLNGNTNLGNANTDTIAVTGILNVDSGTLYVNPTDNRVGINDSTPSEALDVTGNALISGTLGVTGNTTITGDVITSIVKASGSGGLTIDSNGGTDVALFGAGGGSGTTLYGGLNGTTATFSGVIYADDDTTANTPVISFTGDTNTGIGRSAADTLDFVTGGVSRARISSTGLQSSVVPDLSGSNTNLFPEYKCRAWAVFNGGLTGNNSPIGSGNITSVTRNTTGDYTVNFTTNMVDTNYSILAAPLVSGTAAPRHIGYGSILVGSFKIFICDTAGGAVDSSSISVGVFR